MKSRSEVWAAVDSRLDELLTLMRDRRESQCVSTMQGLAVIFHLAALLLKALSEWTTEVWIYLRPLLCCMVIGSHS